MMNTDGLGSKVTTRTAFVGRASRVMKVVTLSALGAVAACSLVVDAERVQCTKSTDCLARGVESVCSRNVCIAATSSGGGTDAGAETSTPVDPVYGCITNPAPKPAPEPNVPVRDGVTAADVSTQERLEGLDVRACLETDTNCATPYATGTTDENGTFATSLFAGMNGYYELSTGTKFPELFGLVLYLDPRPSRDAFDAGPGTLRPASIIPRVGVDIIGSGFGKTVKPIYGHVSFGVKFCSDEFAADAIVRAEPISSDTFVFYTDSGGSPGLTQGKTSSNGHGGFVNLPPGRITLSVTHESGRAIVTRDVIIRADMVTLLDLDPKL